MLIQGKLLSGQDDLAEVYRIRRKVLIDEVKLPEQEVFDEFDNKAIHVLVYEGMEKEKAVATGRIMIDGTRCCMGLIAVLKEARGKEYGDFAVRMLLAKAFQAGIKTVYLKTKKEKSKFFQRFGFRDLEEDSSSILEMVLREEWYSTGCRKKNR